MKTVTGEVYTVLILLCYMSYGSYSQLTFPKGRILKYPLTSIMK